MTKVAGRKWVEFLEVAGWKWVEFLVEGGIPGRRWTAATGLLVELLEVDSGIPDWWKAEAGATR